MNYIDFIKKNKCVRYSTYIVCAYIVGIISAISSIEKDFLFSMKGSIIQILISVIVLYTTLSNLVLSQMAIFLKDKKIDIDMKECIEPFKRNLKIMLSLFAVEIISLIVATIICMECHSDINVCINMTHYSIQYPEYAYWVRVTLNACTAFSIFYFLYCIYDSSLAFYAAYVANNNINRCDV